LVVNVLLVLLSIYIVLKYNGKKIDDLIKTATDLKTSNGKILVEEYRKLKVGSIEERILTRK